MIKVRNESAENFLLLIKEWERLCVSYALVESNVLPHPYVNSSNEQVDEVGGDDEDDDVDDSDGNSSEVFEVKEVLAMCYGDPKESGAVGLYCKVYLLDYQCTFISLSCLFKHFQLALACSNVSKMQFRFAGKVMDQMMIHGSL